LLFLFVMKHLSRYVRNPNAPYFFEIKFIFFKLVPPQGLLLNLDIVNIVRSSCQCASLLRPMPCREERVLLMAWLSAHLTCILGVFGAARTESTKPSAAVALAKVFWAPQVDPSKKGIVFGTT
jgi:hypothetical protein